MPFQTPNPVLRVLSGVLTEIFLLFVWIKTSDLDFRQCPVRWGLTAGQLRAPVGQDRSASSAMFFRGAWCRRLRCFSDFGQVCLTQEH